MSRGFQVINKYRGKDILFPCRKTGKSAGYDLSTAQDVVINAGEMAIVPTGLKAYMEADEVLFLYIRSSLAIKKHLVLMNQVGVIDADYYNNPDNEGHIQIVLFNMGNDTVTIPKGTRIAQAVFSKYLTIAGDVSGVGDKRNGGFGSTGSD